MIDKNSLGASFLGQLHSVRTTADGGGRMTIDFGSDGLEAVQFIQKVSSMGEVNFQVAFVALPERKAYAEEPTSDYADQDGEHVPDSF